MSRARVSFWNVRRIDRRRIAAIMLVLSIISILIALLIIPVVALPIGVYHNHANDENKIALTFDDGPHPRYTLDILNVLKEYNIRATFFLVGENVLYYPEAAKKIVAEGHEVGNHTYSHSCAKKQNEADFRKELTSCENEIIRVTGIKPKVFRPPQGSWNTQVYEIARENGYSVILWDIDTLDWAHTPSKKISDYVLNNVKSGNIILMHDYQSGGCTATEALRQFIPQLIERGYQFVTISELIDS